MEILNSSLRKPKKFILTLYNILKDPQNIETIAWTESGDSFVILDLNQLTSKILPIYFKHGNSSSFIRQLNMYDFHKMRDTGEVLVFKHPFFLRDDSDKLVKVTRKIINMNRKKNNDEKKVLKMKKKLSGLREKVDSLSMKMDEVLKINKTLKEEISKFSERDKKYDQILMLAIKGNKAMSNEMTGINPMSTEQYFMNPVYFPGFLNSQFR